ncbi:MAG: putative extracellular serine protease [Chloroflexi bacterium OLB15]|nr:MAG: putative extracellular serine protease [Chloroflexi bacterium OLB15]
MLLPTYPQYPECPTLLPTPVRMHASNQYTGRGVVIAFIDSGFYPHPDIASRVLCHADATTAAVTEGTRYGKPAWYSWHGQMTSVIAAGDGHMSNGQYQGLAPDARLVLVKVSNPRKRIKETDILRGLRWVIHNAERFNIRIVNLSVGGDFPSNDPDHPIHQAVRTLTQMQVVVVAAAGNKGLPLLTPPASAAEAITVGGINDHNSLNPALWRLYPNNWGQALDGGHKPEVLAPAAWIASPFLPGTKIAREAYWLGQILNAGDNEREVQRLIRSGRQDLGLSTKAAATPTQQVYTSLQAQVASHKVVDANYQFVDGTSVAAAIISSVAAQMLEANPRLSPQEVKYLMMTTAKPLPDEPEEMQGAGLVDARAAVQLAAMTATPS